MNFNSKTSKIKYEKVKLSKTLNINKQSQPEMLCLNWRRLLLVFRQWFPIKIFQNISANKLFTINCVFSPSEQAHTLLEQDQEGSCNITLLIHNHYQQQNLVLTKISFCLESTNLIMCAMCTLFRWLMQPRMNCFSFPQVKS